MKGFLKALYERIFKYHCTECGGVLDWVGFDAENRADIYKCRNCKKENGMIDFDLWNL